MKKVRFGTIILLLLVFSVLSTYAEGANVPPAYSLTTGLPTNQPYRPVLVQISNSVEARPIHGLAAADIVYEAIYWGPAHTRYLALYNDEHPEVVGAVRSSRIFWSEIHHMWDCPFVYWGGQTVATNRTDTTLFFSDDNIQNGMLFDGTKGRWDQVLFRKEGLPAPHNAMVNVARLVDEYWPEDNGRLHEPKTPPWKFSDDYTLGEKEAYIVDLTYEAKEYSVSYVYSPLGNNYDRIYDNTMQADAEGNSIIASNVIVQYTPLSFYGNDLSLPIIPTTGSGPIDVFIGGKHIRGVWYRETIDDWYRYIDSKGNDIIFSVGTTFVQIVPMDMEILITDSNNNTRTSDASMAR